MVRDMDLIRAILLRAEGGENAFLVEGKTEEELFYHVLLARRAGLVEATLSSRGVFSILRLAWKGHDFLDDVRDDAVWAEVKRKLAEKGGGASFRTVVALAQEVAERRLLGP